MNRKIKYLFFLVSFITLNTVILILVILGCTILSEFVFFKLDITGLSKSLANSLGLLIGSMISVVIYYRLYRYAEKKWYIHRIFDFKQNNNLDL